jgi:diguanylate cyclase (GGDEF)-like protein
MDAVVALNDLSAIGAMLALGDVGLRVPEDVLVTGFDDERAAARTWPGLTTVDPQLAEQGRLAMLHLQEAIAGGRRSCPVVVPARPVPRRSTARTPEPGDTRGAVHMARAANTEVAALDAIIELNRAMMTCTALEQVVTELTARLDRLGMARCFVVMYGSEDGPRLLDPATEDQERRRDLGRVVLAHAYGTPRPFDPGPFPTGEVLPGPLADEFGSGTLVVQPLSVPEGDLGYALFEQERNLVNSSEVLRMDLSRTLHAVATAKQLAEHAATLERQVAQRTRQLSAEVANRQRAEHELQRMNDELQRSLMLDGLTRIANRVAFQRHLEQHWLLLAAAGAPLALLMVDVDLFKAYNDRYGHLVGDEALRKVASCLDAAVRDPQDLACRYGGEEFAVVLPRTGVAGATAVAERFRALLADEAIPHEASSISRVVTASVGIAAVQVSPGGDPVHLVDAADRALYRAKRAGRNRVAVQGPTVDLTLTDPLAPDVPTPPTIPLGRAPGR